MRIISFLLSLVLLSSISIAQHERPPHMSKEQKQALRSEVKAYLDAEVLPIVAPLRTAFDANLNAEEQQLISDTREKLQEMRQAHRAERPQRSKEGQRPSEAERETFRAQREAHRAEMEALLEPIHELAAVHAVELRSTLKELRPQANVWKTDLRAIVESHRPEKEEEGRADHTRAEGKGRRGHRAHGHPGSMGRGLGHMLRPVGFLLWSPDQPLMPEETANLTVVSTYPNPAQSETTLKVNLVEASTVTASILDGRGQVLRQLKPQALAAGEQTISVDLRDLRAGVYFIRLDDGLQSTVQKIAVK